MRYWFCLLVLLVSSFATSAQAQKALSIHRVADGLFVYTTYKLINDVPFPSNSMYAVTDGGVVMIDTPWDTTQTQALLDSIFYRHHQAVLMCVVTHSHDDRTAGLDQLKRVGVKTFSTAKTNQISLLKQEKLATQLITNDTAFQVGNVAFEIFYPGEGHTADNVVVWFPRQRVLFGGCLVKSVEAKGLGNIADANLEMWPHTIRNVKRKFNKSKIVVPGHQEWGSTKALRHTLKLLKKNS